MLDDPLAPVATAEIVAAGRSRHEIQRAIKVGDTLCVHCGRCRQSLQAHQSAVAACMCHCLHANSSGMLA